MSTNLATSPRARYDVGSPDDDLFDAPAPRRGPIEIVTSRVQRQARPRILYALIATAALFVLLLTQLGVSIALSQGAYQISALQDTQTSLSRSQQKYSEKLQVLSSPQNIANNAAALGMIRNQNPVYLDLSTEKVYGTPTPAVGDAKSSQNLIPNSLLKGTKVVTKAPSTAKSPASSSSTTGAAATDSTAAKVPSTTNQLAAPQTR
ncbi:hypothetical protein GCM10025867_26730 [Frondihabitans sucicola]|uniref:Cell division protein FtsL n=1 Tax=Frondihabitans sucicola TaxID=1268041 RepID=A0ABM8GPQ5_9MICO|nr:hypothetical protein [Frondihabitans sucicola]BDZ50432.1 hypothetical protein GCM10025867_26730 [Frondihabitans sucicola]